MTLSSSFIFVRCMNFKTKLRVLSINDLDKQTFAYLRRQNDYLNFKIETDALTGATAIRMLFNE